MATFKTFEEIEAWRQARSLTKQVYAVSGKGAFGRDFGLRDQIRRASVSAMSNIAEGFGRGGGKEFIQFLSVARGSASEVCAQLYVALDQGYLTQKEFEQLQEQSTRTGSLISGLIRYLQSTRLRGSKFSQKAERSEPER
jgi:four helix bundle protein